MRKIYTIFYFGSTFIILLLLGVNYPRNVSFVFVRKIERQQMESIEIDTAKTHRGKCFPLETNALKHFAFGNTFSTGIPNIIHYYSLDEKVSDQSLILIKNCANANPDMRIVLWTESSFHTIFNKSFPRNVIKKWHSVFNTMNKLTKQIIVRVMVLYLFGGVSLSMDTECGRPMTDTIISHRCFGNGGSGLKAHINYYRQSKFGESLIGCTAGHPFLESLIFNEMRLPVNQFYLSEHYRYYNNLQEKSRIFQLDSIINQDRLWLKKMMEICQQLLRRRLQLKACKMLDVHNVTEDIHSNFYLQSTTIPTSNVKLHDICSIGIEIFVVISS